MSESPRSVDVGVVRSRAGRQRRALRTVAAAVTTVVVATAIGVSLALMGGHGPPKTVTAVGALPAAVIASPSQKLTNGQTVKIVVRNFPPNQKVDLSECPSLRMIRGATCANATPRTVLSASNTGTASGSFVVQYEPQGFLQQFGQAFCTTTCLLVATSRPSPSALAAIATTVLSFATVPLPSPSPSNSPEPPGFGVSAASFVSSTQGWALGSTGCDGCAGVAVTLDGGKSWAYLPPPPTTLGRYSNKPTAVTNITFANYSDGYLYTPGLLVTTDGGQTWVAQRLTGIRALVIAGAYVYALSDSSYAPRSYSTVAASHLYRARIGTSSWQKVALPATIGQSHNFQIAAAGMNLVLLETGSSSSIITAAQLGRIWVSYDQGASWQARSVPCTVADGSATVISVALDHPEAWLLACYDNLQSSEEVNTLQHIYGTTDGGQAWVRLGNPPQHNGPVLMADNGAGHAFIATLGVADTLNGTLNGGHSWTVSIRDGGSFFGWADLEFINATTGFVVGPTHYAPEHLYRTTDSGRTWHALTVSP